MRARERLLAPTAPGSVQVEPLVCTEERLLPAQVCEVPAAGDLMCRAATARNFS
jgi:hypothetical protein